MHAYRKLTALTHPMDRVMYSPLAPRKADFDLVRDLMIETGVLDRKSSSMSAPTRDSQIGRLFRPPGNMRRV